jgi:FMN reductase
MIYGYINQLVRSLHRSEIATRESPVPFKELSECWSSHSVAVPVSAPVPGCCWNARNAGCKSKGVEVVSYQVRDFPAEDLLHARFDSPKVLDLLQQIENADGLLIATPVYKASFSGALKTVLDLLPERALNHKIVLPMATGGSIAHMLVVDYALKPVLSALKAQEMLQGIFAESTARSLTAKAAPRRNWRRHWNSDCMKRWSQFVSAMARRPKPLDPGLLNERLLSARWSI